MSFHEKTRLLSLAVTLLVWGFYFVGVTTDLLHGTVPENWYFWRLAPVFLASAVVAAVSATALALWSPKEAQACLDERERHISNQAGTIAYTLLSVGIVFVIAGSFAGWSIFVIINALLFAFVLTECTRYSIELWKLRQ